MNDKFDCENSSFCDHYNKENSSCSNCDCCRYLEKQGIDTCNMPIKEINFWSQYFKDRHPKIEEYIDNKIYRCYFRSNKTSPDRNKEFITLTYDKDLDAFYLYENIYYKAEMFSKIELDERSVDTLAEDEIIPGNWYLITLEQDFDSDDTLPLRLLLKAFRVLDDDGYSTIAFSIDGTRNEGVYYYYHNIECCEAYD